MLLSQAFECQGKHGVKVRKMRRDASCLPEGFGFNSVLQVIASYQFKVSLKTGPRETEDDGIIQRSQGILPVPFFPVMLSPALLLSKLRANNLRFLLLSSPDDTFPDFWLNKPCTAKNSSKILSRQDPRFLFLFFNVST